MIMADVLTWFLIIIGAWLVLNAYWLASTALFPALVEESRETYGRRPIAATLLGLALLAPLLVVGLTTAKVAPHPGLGGLIIGGLLLLALIALFGSAGLALRIGAGLGPASDAASPWRRVARGGTVLAFTFLLPLLGWFIILPWTLASGFGVAIMVLWRRAFPRTRVATSGDTPRAITAVAQPK